MMASRCYHTTRVLHSDTRQAVFPCVALLEWPWQDVMNLYFRPQKHAVSKQDT